jgi:hypothetical protein
MQQQHHHELNDYLGTEQTCHLHFCSEWGVVAHTTVKGQIRRIAGTYWVGTVVVDGTVASIGVDEQVDGSLTVMVNV